MKEEPKSQRSSWLPPRGREEELSDPQAAPVLAIEGLLGLHCWQGAGQEECSFPGCLLLPSGLILPWCSVPSRRRSVIPSS